MKVTVCFGDIRVIVPCGHSEIVRDLIEKAVLRYKKALAKSPDCYINVHTLKSQHDGGILDPDDVIGDVVDDREQIVAEFAEQIYPSAPQGGDGTSASSDSSTSPDIYQNVSIKPPTIQSRRASPPQPRRVSPPQPRHVSPPQLRRASPPQKRLPTTSLTSAFVGRDVIKPRPEIGRPRVSLTQRNSVEVTERDLNSNKASGLQVLSVRHGSEPNLSAPDVTRDQSVRSETISNTSGYLRVKSRVVQAVEEEPAGFRPFSRGSPRRSLTPQSVIQWAEAKEKVGGSYPSGQQAETVNSSREEPLGQSRSPGEESHREASLVVLKNEGGPLGIHVVPYQDPISGKNGLAVHGIEPGGRVHRAGQLSPGDIIEEINGSSLLNTSFAQAQNIFRDALLTPELRLLVRFIHSKQPMVINAPTANVRKPDRASAPTRKSLPPPPPLRSPLTSLSTNATVTEAIPLQLPPRNHQSTVQSSGFIQSAIQAPALLQHSILVPEHSTQLASAADQQSESLDKARSSDTHMDAPNGAIDASGTLLSKPLAFSATFMPSGVIRQPLAVPAQKVKPPVDVSGVTTSNLAQQETPISTSLKKIFIDLRKGPEGLGFSITTRDNPAGGVPPIYVKNILPKGAAISDGRLKSGDRLLEVNGLTLSGKSQDEVVAVLRNTKRGSTVSLLVSRSEAEDDAADLPRQLTEEAIKIEPKAQHLPSESVLDREILVFNIPLNESGSAGLGVSVKGKTTTLNSTTKDLGIFIKAVIHGGAASKDGRLHINDQLLSVNNVDLKSKTNSEAMETLRQAMQSEGPTPGHIKLCIARRLGFTEGPVPLDATDGGVASFSLSGVGNAGDHEKLIADVTLQQPPVRPEPAIMVPIPIKVEPLTAKAKPVPIKPDLATFKAEPSLLKVESNLLKAEPNQLKAGSEHLNVKEPSITKAEPAFCNAETAQVKVTPVIKTEVIPSTIEPGFNIERASSVVPPIKEKLFLAKENQLRNESYQQATSSDQEELSGSAADLSVSLRKPSGSVTDDDNMRLSEILHQPANRRRSQPAKPRPFTIIGAVGLLESEAVKERANKAPESAVRSASPSAALNDDTGDTGTFDRKSLGRQSFSEKRRASTGKSKEVTAKVKALRDDMAVNKGKEFVTGLSASQSALDLSVTSAYDNSSFKSYSRALSLLPVQQSTSLLEIPDSLLSISDSATVKRAASNKRPVPTPRKHVGLPSQTDSGSQATLGSIHADVKHVSAPTTPNDLSNNSAAPQPEQSVLEVNPSVVCATAAAESTTRNLVEGVASVIVSHSSEQRQESPRQSSKSMDEIGKLTNSAGLGESLGFEIVSVPAVTQSFSPTLYLRSFMAKQEPANKVDMTDTGVQCDPDPDETEPLGTSLKMKPVLNREAKPQLAESDKRDRRKSDLIESSPYPRLYTLAAMDTFAPVSRDYETSVDTPLSSSLASSTLSPRLLTLGRTSMKEQPSRAEKQGDGIPRSSSVLNLADQRSGADDKSRQKSSRARGCNESFRAAVDRSYESAKAESLQMMSVNEERDRSNSAIPTLDVVTEDMEANSKKVKKSKGGILGKFRLGKHRKSIENGTLKSKEGHGKEGHGKEANGKATVHGEESERYNKTQDQFDKARNVHKAEQDRIQEHYKRLQEKQKFQSVDASPAYHLTTDNNHNYQNKSSRAGSESSVHPPNYPTAVGGQAIFKAPSQLLGEPPKYQNVSGVPAERLEKDKGWQNVQVWV